MSEKKGEIKEESYKKKPIIPIKTETRHLLTSLRIIEGDMPGTIQFSKEFIYFINEYPREIYNLTKNYSKMTSASSSIYRLYDCLTQAVLDLWLSEIAKKLSIEDLVVAREGLLPYVISFGLFDWIKKARSRPIDLNKYFARVREKQNN